MPNRIEREDGRPEEERCCQVEEMLKVMDERVLKRRVKERREVRRPHHKGEQDPGNEWMRDHPNGATLQ